MEPKTVAEVLAKIAQQYEASCKDRAAMEMVLESRAQAILAQQKTLATRDLEIGELKRQRDDDLPRLAREIDGWKAKHEKATANVKTLAAGVEESAKTIADLQAKLAAETARADALAAKYDPQIQADMAARAESERLRQIAELELRLKALKRE